MKKFVGAEKLWDRTSTQIRKEIDAEVGAFILAEDAARVKDADIHVFAAHVKAFGAKVFAEMPDGTKVSLPFRGL